MGEWAAWKHILFLFAVTKSELTTRCVQMAAQTDYVCGDFGDQLNYTPPSRVCQANAPSDMRDRFIVCPLA